MESLTDNTGIITGSFILLSIFVWNVLVVKRCTSNRAGTISIVLSLTTLILCLPIIIIFLAILTIYYNFINLILKIKFGSKFRGLLVGGDAFHMMNESSQGVIHCLILVKCITKHSPEDFFNSIKQVLWKFHRHSKFRRIFLKQYGYSFMLKEDLSVDDCIKKLETINCHKKPIKKKDLLMILNNCCNAPLPKNDTVGWEMLIGTQPVNWNGDDNEYYPFLMRINHAVADGVTIMKLMIELADKQDLNIKSIGKFSDVSSNEQRSSENIQSKDDFQIFLNHIYNIPFSLFYGTQKLLNVIFRSLYVFLLFPASLVVNFLFKAKDANILNKPMLSGKKILALGVEKSEEYFLKIKKIKNKIPRTRFSDVLITAFSASLTEYLEKNMVKPPQFATATVPVLYEALNLQHAIPGKLVREKIRNGYSSLLMTLPIAENKFYAEKDYSLIRRLKLIKNEAGILRNCSDYYVNYFIISFVCSILPHPIGKFMLSRTRSSTVISILPPSPTFTYCDGSMTFEDVIPWVPHLHNVGTTFLTDTHRDRLRIGFSVDKALLDNEDIAQSIVTGVYKYLDLLAKEADSIYPDVE